MHGPDQVIRANNHRFNTLQATLPLESGSIKLYLVKTLRSYVLLEAEERSAAKEGRSAAAVAGRAGERANGLLALLQTVAPAKSGVAIVNFGLHLHSHSLFQVFVEPSLRSLAEYSRYACHQGIGYVLLQNCCCATNVATNVATNGAYRCMAVVCSIDVVKLLVRTVPPRPIPNKLPTVSRACLANVPRTTYHVLCTTYHVPRSAGSAACRCGWIRSANTL